MKKAMIFLLALIVLLGCCACGNDESAESPYEKYAKHKDLFECLEVGDLESAQSYLEDFFGVTLTPTVPATQPTEPTQPPTEATQPPTEPTQPSTEPTQSDTVPAEPPTEPTEPPTEPTDPTELPGEPTDPSETPDEQTEMVWIPKSGEKYHTRPDCSNMKNPTLVTKEEAEAEGFTPCKRCHE